MKDYTRRRSALTGIFAIGLLTLTQVSTHGASEKIAGPSTEGVTQVGKTFVANPGYYFKVSADGKSATVMAKDSGVEKGTFTCACQWPDSSSGCNVTVVNNTLSCGGNDCCAPIIRPEKPKNDAAAITQVKSAGTLQTQTADATVQTKVPPGLILRNNRYYPEKGVKITVSPDQSHATIARIPAGLGGSAKGPSIGAPVTVKYACGCPAGSSGAKDCKVTLASDGSLMCSGSQCCTLIVVNEIK